MHETAQSAALYRFEGDGDSRNIGTEVRASFPPPPEDDPPTGLHLDERAGRNMARITVQRYWPPARRSTRADTLFQRRNRSGSVISANASSVDTGSRTVFSASIPVLLGGLGQSSIESTGGRIGDQEIELSRPEALKLLAQLSHSGRHLAVDASPAVLAANYQPHLGQHAEMLRDRRTSHREIGG